MTKKAGSDRLTYNRELVRRAERKCSNFDLLPDLDNANVGKYEMTGIFAAHTRRLVWALFLFHGKVCPMKQKKSGGR